MSTIAVQNFKDPTTDKSVDAAYVTDGVAKAWANLNGTGTIALRDSFNVASTTDEGTGAYSYALSSNMADANGIPSAAVASQDPMTTISSNRTALAALNSASEVWTNVTETDGTNNFSDAITVGFSLFGDLA